ncbi:acyltransferase family protein [Streptomyces sp. NPDC015492]|uniref:acyltransferase family protein n=1 Tax=Streptomyces sp. NPDC015492 TaxID=3364958 RepID=UPI0036FDBA12
MPLATRQGHQQTPGPRLPSLTGLRCIAAFMVFFYHARNFGYFEPGQSGQLVNWAFGPGVMGVSFFFILSGFVLSWSARSEEPARAFWRRRLARIYPIHLVTAVITLLLAYTLLPGLQPSGAREAAANLLLVSAWRREWWQALNPVSWSLVCEAFFYAVFPVLQVGLRRLSVRTLKATAFTGVLCVMLLPWANTHYALDWALHSSPISRLPEFVLGMTLGLLVKNGVWRGPGLDISLAVTLIGYFLAAQIPPEYGYAACTVTGLALLIPAAATADLTRTPSPWRRPYLVRLGELSFAFYMIHILVMRCAELLFGTRPRLETYPALAVTAAILAVSLALAWVLYISIERPGQRLLLPARHASSRSAPMTDSTDPGNITHAPRAIE